MLIRHSRAGRMFAAVFLAAVANTMPIAEIGYLGSTPAMAQGVVTVAAVSGALSKAIDDFKSAISQAGDEFRSVGNSLQANAQNVLQDMNKILKDRMDQAVTALDQQERRIAEDAEALTRQLQKATEAVVAKAGEQARLTIVEADISAYDTLYSLPCRDQRPRIVAAFPGEVVVSQSVPLMTLRGNYLRQGGPLSASIDGRTAKIVERLDHSIKVEMPEDFAPLTLERTRTESIQIAGLSTLDRTLWFGLLCREKNVVQDPVLAAITVSPQIKWSLSGWLKSTHLVETETVEPVRKFDRTGSDHCDDSFDVSTQYCATNPAAVRTAGVLAVTSANCGSGANSPQPSGPRCVLVPGRVQGCGANRGPFNTWLGCKGRGWLKYDLTLKVVTESRADAGTSAIEVSPSVAEKSWSFTFPPTSGRDPAFEYQVVIKQTQGDVTLNSWTISGANPNAGPVKSRLADRALAIKLAD